MNRQRLKDKCGMRASPTAELVFENVSLPAANLIGQPGGATVSTDALPGEERLPSLNQRTNSLTSA